MSDALREWFEAWHRATYEFSSLDRYPDGTYERPMVEGRWIGFRAGAAIAEPVARDVVGLPVGAKWDEHEGCWYVPAAIADEDDPPPGEHGSLCQRTAPETIYLQISDDRDHYNEEFPDCGGDEVTWCRDSVLACEVKYIRADRAAIAEEPLGEPFATVLADNLSALTKRAAAIADEGKDAAPEMEPYWILGRGGMVQIHRVIRTPEGHTAALRRIEQLMDARHGTPEGEELDALTHMVERYEAEHDAAMKESDR